MAINWEATTTNSAGTKEWIEASKDMSISVYLVNGPSLVDDVATSPTAKLMAQDDTFVDLTARGLNDLEAGRSSSLDDVKRRLGDV